MQDRYGQAASRHLRDAGLLLQNGRFDNAVYLAGYVAECCLKSVIEVFTTYLHARSYGHNLSKLEGVGLQRAIRVCPQAQSYVPSVALTHTPLAHAHPVRRYWKNGVWTQQCADAVVKLAKEIYRETIIRLVLDGKLRREELE
ncbi:HEPN domain-containing protein [Alicyclobacillus macrosporangiidus]|uniref:HEPN domain-containing protein n=1 Tax=Alicyclobacillus macrosporangiidus TaxID=392015 RepID=A0A1I7JIF5_9BACL|nr:HEPN domain-containing protein [Alicyclobacillus macrosporangiidus]SFU84921.1 HEPN domain-containing protein [Alicyclobacillus macrosporangiidus]